MFEDDIDYGTGDVAQKDKVAFTKRIALLVATLCGLGVLILLGMLIYKSSNNQIIDTISIEPNSDLKTIMLFEEGEGIQVDNIGMEVYDEVSSLGDVKVKKVPTLKNHAMILEQKKIAKDSKTVKAITVKKKVKKEAINKKNSNTKDVAVKPDSKVVATVKTIIKKDEDVAKLGLKFSNQVNKKNSNIKDGAVKYNSKIAGAGKIVTKQDKAVAGVRSKSEDIMNSSQKAGISVKVKPEQKENDVAKRNVDIKVIKDKSYVTNNDQKSANKLGKINAEVASKKIAQELVSKVSLNNAVSDIDTELDINDNSSVRVQLISLKTHEAILEYRDKLLTNHEDLFVGHEIHIEIVDLVDEGSFYRLQVSRFDSIQDANEFCEMFENADLRYNCIVVKHKDK